jgi:hypothetical protein
MAEKPKRTWFNHTCHFCGLESRETDMILGDGVYQCVRANRDACQERHDALDPIAFARLEKPYCDPERDWSPSMRARFAEVRQMIAAVKTDRPISPN